MITTLPLRALVTAALAAALAAPLAAQEVNELEPWDRVPRVISVERFSRMTEADLYRAALAVKHGRRILVDGCTPSESREILRAATRDHRAALTLLRKRCPD